MRTEAMLPLEEIPSLDDAADLAPPPELVPHRGRLRVDDRDDDELGLRSLAECPEWLSRAYWRRMQAA